MLSESTSDSRDFVVIFDAQEADRRPSEHAVLIREKT